MPNASTFSRTIGGREVDVFARLVKLKPGSAERVREWAATMNARKAEAEATLVNEGVDVESWFSITLNGEDYLMSYIRAESMEEAQRIAAQSAHPIDAIHQQFKADAWVRGGGAVGTLLLDLSRRR